MNRSIIFIFVVFLMTAANFLSARERLLGNTSISGLEGSSGGVIVPWATIAKGDAHENVVWTGSTGLVETDDLSLSHFGVAYGMLDWLELSFARLSLQIDQSADVIRQNIIGMKIRLNSGYIYEAPLWSIGIQQKNIDNSNDFSSSGLGDKGGTDFYLAGTYLSLAPFLHRNVIYSGNIRYTKANQIGLLGFGSTDSNFDDYEFVFEASLALQLNKRHLLGAEFRGKPNNLSAFSEEPWRSVYYSYAPNANVTMSVAWLSLGEVLGVDEQQGAWISVEASF